MHIILRLAYVLKFIICSHYKKRLDIPSLTPTQFSTAAIWITATRSKHLTTLPRTRLKQFKKL